MKKIISVFLSLVMIINVFALFSINDISAEAADYAAELRSKGFPESYIDSLVALHKKYPNWIFEPLNTNLDFATAVKGERKNHSQQLIQKSSGTSSSMYCSCSSCQKNGNYVIQEASNWVSASQKAVEYYMDPRNFLNEEGIFQFESTRYNGTQTQEGVEAILDGTWMHDSLISYYNTAGSYVTMKSRITYSDSIMKAANDSGMSAYYLASKIRQENGGSKATATAVKGTASPFQGIYNYYNIGAYSGAYDGLAWAAGYLRTNKTATLYSDYNSSTGKVSGTKTTLKSGQYMTWMANCGKYYRVRLYAETSSGYIAGRVGYILKSDLRTTYTGTSGSGWGRPWYTPHLSIYYGAKYIAQNYKTQFTGYLQKFNVNPESDTLYSHEYMANVAAAASESKTTYNAYKSAGILSITKTFSIPVFKNMPNDDTSEDTGSGSSSGSTSTATNTLPCVTGLKATGSDTKQIDLTWNKVSGASGYYVDIMKNGKYVRYGSTTSNKISVKGLNSFQEYTFRVKAYKNVSGTTYYGKYWVGVTYGTRASKVSNFRSTGSNNSVIYLSWSKNSRATGYKVFKYDPATKKDVLYKDIKGANNTTLSVTGLKNNTKYQFKIYAYYKGSVGTYNGYCSSALSASTKLNMVTMNSVTSPSKKRITVKWNKAWFSCTGYEVMWSTTSNFSSNFLSVYVKGQNTLSTTLNTAQSGRNYYVRTRVYTEKNGKKTYGSWSAVKTIKVK